MIRHLNSLGEMALVLVERELVLHEMLEKGLEQALERIEATAKAELGHYQSAKGSFPEWPELTDATKADRVAQGYTEDDPLLRSGELRESIKHEHQGYEGVVGSMEPVALFQELGTAKMPARPFLGPAAFTNKDAIQRLIGAAAIAGIVGAHEARGLEAALIHDGLGYNITTKG